LKDLNLTTNDYNNGTTIQVLAFLSELGNRVQLTAIEITPHALSSFSAFEFPSQLIVARVGFKRWLPFLMFCWGIVSCLQAFMTNRWVIQDLPWTKE
jgi:hypothetical protein